MLSAGTEQGLAAGSPVLSPDGLVGVVTSTGQHHSLVQTLLNPEFRVAVIDTRTGLPAMAHIGPGEVLELSYVPPDGDIVAGDTLVTAGLGTVFPKGFRVGIVTAVRRVPNALFLQVVARPFVDVRRLERVFVMLIPDSVAMSDSSGWLANLVTPEVSPPSSTMNPFPRDR